MAASSENVHLQENLANDEPRDDNRALTKISSEVRGEQVETAEEDGNSDTKRHKTRRGLAFLRRKWTVHEILTTSGLFFEVLGFVSLSFYRPPTKLWEGNDCSHMCLPVFLFTSVGRA